MKDLWIFIALGLNALLFLFLLVVALAQGVRTEPGVMALLVATAPASALMALGSWRRPKSA